MSSQPPGALAGKPAVLIIDDEELIREVASMMIEDEGGVAMVAPGGTDALKLFEENSEKIGCVCSDFSMPVMNGYEVYLQIVKRRPELPFIMLSGLKIVPEVEELRRQGKIQFLGKPFHQTDLISAITRAIDKGAAK